MDAVATSAMDSDDVKQTPYVKLIRCATAGPRTDPNERARAEPSATPRSAEGHEFWVDRKCANTSGTIKAMLSGPRGPRPARAARRPRRAARRRPVHGELRRDQVPGDLDAHPREGHPVLLLQTPLHEQPGPHPGVPDRPRDGARAADGEQLPGLLIGDVS